MTVVDEWVDQLPTLMAPWPAITWDAQAVGDETVVVTFTAASAPARTAKLTMSGVVYDLDVLGASFREVDDLTH